jgi:hypothetical protein
MNLNGDPTIERSISRASGRSRNSTLSRNQSLIKKNIGLQDLKPADVLIERFVAWKAIVKQLTAYFEVCFFPFSFWNVAYISCPGHRRHREQYCQGAHKARWRHSGPFPGWKSVFGRRRPPGETIISAAKSRHLTFA